MVTSVMDDHLVFAKQGYKLESALNNYCIQAEIRIWNNGKDILDFVSLHQNSTQIISIFKKNKNKLAIFDFDSTIKEHPKESTFGGLTKLFANQELPENIMSTFQEQGWDAAINSVFETVNVTKKDVIEALANDGEIIKGYIDFAPKNRLCKF